MCQDLILSGPWVQTLRAEGPLHPAASFPEECRLTQFPLNSVEIMADLNLRP